MTQGLVLKPGAEDKDFEYNEVYKAEKKIVLPLMGQATRKRQLGGSKITPLAHDFYISIVGF